MRLPLNHHAVERRRQDNERKQGSTRICKDRRKHDTCCCVPIVISNILLWHSDAKGFVQYTTEPWEGCESYTARESIIDREGCEIIVNGIMTFVSNHFPDSEVIYDDNTKRYTLKWDYKCPLTMPVGLI